MTRIKICGITEQIHALAASEAGADFIGMVFAHSKRRISPEQGKIIVDAVRRQGGNVQTVGIFVNSPVSELNEVADYCGLDWVQLSGEEPVDYCLQINQPLIKVVKIDNSLYRSPDEVMEILTMLKAGLGSRRFIFLLDSAANGRAGGTGKTFNWELGKMAISSLQVIIAGGLNVKNVSQLIKGLAPWGVDVSSGVESDDKKDVKKIREFIESVRSADGR